MGHILRMNPVFKEMIWGGTKLKDIYGYEIPSDHTGECWAISAHKNGDCTIADGEYKGKTLSWLFENHRELFGNIKGDQFPLLVKIIDAKNDLSVRRYTRFNHQAGAVQKLDFDGLQIDLENRSVTTSNGTFELPPKEFDLLLYCAKHQGKILTKQQIYEEVWGEEYFYDDSNIMAIISRLRKKLEVNPSSPKYIQTVKGIGYRFNKEV